MVQLGGVVEMAGAPWDPRGEALSALRAIAADPQYGTEALSSAQTMTNLLKDMLPDAPREANVLIAATGAGVPAALQGFVAQGMDVKMASQLAAGALADKTALTADACTWATGSLATVLIPPQAATQPDVTGSEPTAAITSAIAPGRGPRRAAGLSAAAAAVIGAGALATILACAFSFIHLYNSDGTYSHSESLFSFTGGYGGAWFWLAPVVVAVLSAAAGLVLALSRASWLRGAAAGVAAASGAAVICYFAAWQFMLGPVGDGTGPAGAEKLGAFGGLLLLVAGVLGLVAAARR